MHKVSTVAFIITGFGCAMAQPSELPPAGPAMYASSQSTPLHQNHSDRSETPKDEFKNLDPGVAAGILLERAVGAFNRGEFSNSAALFQRALDTKRLNDAGKVLAYWHIFVAEQESGHIDAASDALSSFSVVAQDVLSSVATKSFAHRFKLSQKLDNAHAILSALWSTRHREFGLSPAKPVPVRNTQEMEYFLSLVSPCQDDVNPKMTRMGSEETELEHIQLSCEGQVKSEALGAKQAVNQKTPKSYYFQMPNRVER